MNPPILANRGHSPVLCSNRTMPHFTVRADVVYNLDDFGLGSVHGTSALRTTTRALGSAHPVGHHVTNIVITSIDDRTARVRSKGIAIEADGSAGSVVYDDIVTQQPEGWKISYRKVSARRAPLGGQPAP